MKNQVIKKLGQVFLVFALLFSGLCYAQEPSTNVATKGMNVEQKRQEVEKLNLLLSDLSVFYQNARGLHWKVRGNQFFELHAKYEELYRSLQARIDEVAERVLALGGSPLVLFQDYLKHSSIRAVGDVSDPVKGVQLVVESLKKVLARERDICQLCNKLGDEATNHLIDGYRAQNEKDLWMYEAFLQ